MTACTASRQEIKDKVLLPRVHKEMKRGSALTCIEGLLTACCTSIFGIAYSSAAPH